MRDPYEVLGVAKNASAKEIKAAYRKLAKKHHPDQNPNDSKAKDRFAAANQAYEILGDEKSRAASTAARSMPRASRASRVSRAPAAIPSPASAASRPAQAAVPAASVSSFAAAAATRSVAARRHFQRDLRPGAFRSDQGRAAERAAAPRRPRRQRDARRHRRGGRDRAKVTAMFPDGRKISVKLPAYVEDGQTIRLKGQGEQGFGGAGRRAGQDPLPQASALPRRGPRPACRPARAAEGCRARREARRRDADRQGRRQRAGLVELGQGARLKGRGLPEKTGGHGDLYAHVRVMLPEGGDPELEALMRKALRSRIRGRF